MNFGFVGEAWPVRLRLGGAVAIVPDVVGQSRHLGIGVDPAHLPVVDDYLDALRTAVDDVRGVGGSDSSHRTY